MKFKNIKHSFSRATFAVALTAGVFSCNTELLDPIPKTTFSDVVVFDTPARIDLQLNGLYAAVKNGGFLGGRFQIYGDIRADDFLNRTNNGVTGLPVWNQTLTETDANATINCWNTGYAAINQINVFLQGMEDNATKFVPPTFSATYATTAAQYVAEAKALRALSYYQLLQLYARPYTDGNGSQPGLPLRLKGEKNSSNNDLARSTVGEVYTQILDDLNTSESVVLADFPAGTTQTSLRVTRVHRNTIIALKTRVYLSMGNYASVITEANKIVSGSGPFTATSGVPHALSASIATVFSPPQLTNESILSFPFTAQNTPGGQNQLGYYYNASDQGGNGEYALNGAGIIANTTEWPATDARRAFNVFSTAAQFTYLRKYQNPSPYLDNAPVIRYSEVLLNLAEARVRSTGTVDVTAIALLNAVHRRSDTSITFTAGDFVDANALAAKILTERRIEFLGEGLRNADIMRLKVTIPGKGSVPAVAFGASNYVWPIPSSELAANTLMTRN